jgi:hypothetical protein
MTDYKQIAFDELQESDLLVDALYQGGTFGNAGDDPISKLIGCGNQGGFRFVGSAKATIKLCVLYSALTDTDWPDYIDTETGLFIYYGDNKTPGHALHETRRKGNRILKLIFNSLHTDNRIKIPPLFCFTKGPSGRDVFFRGLAVPGAKNRSSNEDLVAVWKTKGSQRFQNYKATFTILEVPAVERKWINDIHIGKPLSSNAPKPWKTWIQGGNYKPLIAPKAVTHRTKEQQLPEPGKYMNIVEAIIDYFKQHPQGEYAFERCAAEIAVLMDKNIADYDLTKPWRDGGRDALGKYNIGYQGNQLDVEFALEAKCKFFNSGSGVKETSRLISRLRYRQFGIFVTTSYVSEQAYKEIVEDGHPVIIVSGADIAQILVNEGGYKSVGEVKDWLKTNFPY